MDFGQPAVCLRCAAHDMVLSRSAGPASAERLARYYDYDYYCDYCSLVVVVVVVVVVVLLLLLLLLLNMLLLLRGRTKPDGVTVPGETSAKDMDKEAAASTTKQQQ